MPDATPYPGTPRWVKASGIIAMVVILLVIILRFTGHGPGLHGPGRHMPFGDRGTHTPPVEHGTQHP